MFSMASVAKTIDLPSGADSETYWFTKLSQHLP